MNKMHNPPHPGEVLREYLPEAMTLIEVATRLGVTRQAMSVVLNGQAGVSAEMAVPCQRRWARAPISGCDCRCNTLMAGNEQTHAARAAACGVGAKRKTVGEVPRHFLAGSLSSWVGIYGRAMGYDRAIVT